MKLIMILLALTLLAGCAVVPIAPYDDYGPYYSSPYYAPPVYGYHGYGYYTPWYNRSYEYGHYGPRHHGYYGGRGSGYRGGYGHYR